LNKLLLHSGHTTFSIDPSPHSMTIITSSREVKHGRQRFAVR